MTSLFKETQRNLIENRVHSYVSEDSILRIGNTQFAIVGFPSYHSSDDINIFAVRPHLYSRLVWSLVEMNGLLDIAKDRVGNIAYNAWEDAKCCHLIGLDRRGVGLIELTIFDMGGKNSVIEDMPSVEDPAHHPLVSILREEINREFNRVIDITGDTEQPVVHIMSSYFLGHGHSKKTVLPILEKLFYGFEIGEISSNHSLMKHFAGLLPEGYDSLQITLKRKLRESNYELVL